MLTIFRDDESYSATRTKRLGSPKTVPGDTKQVSTLALVERLEKLENELAQKHLLRHNEFERLGARKRSEEPSGVPTNSRRSSTPIHAQIPVEANNQGTSQGSNGHSSIRSGHRNCFLTDQDGMPECYTVSWKLTKTGTEEEVAVPRFEITRYFQLLNPHCEISVFLPRR